MVFFTYFKTFLFLVPSGKARSTSLWHFLKPFHITDSCLERYCSVFAISPFSRRRSAMITSRFATWLLVSRWTSCCFWMVTSRSATVWFRVSHHSTTSGSFLWASRSSSRLFTGCSYCFMYWKPPFPWTYAWKCSSMEAKSLCSSSPMPKWAKSSSCAEETEASHRR
ncbi:unknown [Clostridium sp. CAG:58]|nr:unknown [Clostridium sp. CAG:58]